MTNLIKNFAKSESGAVTVDWVVLTAALVGLGLAVMAVVSGGVQDLSGEIQASLATADPGNGTAFVTPIIGGGNTLAD
jgi:Flp pilus assembly pilin Flp